MRPPLLLALLPLFAGCQPSAPPDAAAAPPQAVTVATAIPGSLATPIILAATLVAREEAVVAVDGAGGRVVEMAVEVGDRVAAGALLARLDGHAPRHELDQRRAEEVRAEAVAAQAAAQRDQARLAQAEAHRAHARAEALAAGGNLSAETAEARRTA
ncbi:MAG: biotin/lipoyl-binding protein, partial [Planctomycetes bacterium]|nr:biotin/lipoyl-binding protein [Planctomycetota bacterium]